MEIWPAGAFANIKFRINDGSVVTYSLPVLFCGENRKSLVWWNSKLQFASDIHGFDGLSGCYYSKTCFDHAACVAIWNKDMAQYEASVKATTSEDIVKRLQEVLDGFLRAKDLDSKVTTANNNAEVWEQSYHRVFGELAKERSDRQKADQDNIRWTAKIRELEEELESSKSTFAGECAVTTLLSNENKSLKLTVEELNKKAALDVVILENKLLKAKKAFTSDEAARVLNSDIIHQANIIKDLKKECASIKDLLTAKDAQLKLIVQRRDQDLKHWDECSKRDADGIKYWRNLYYEAVAKIKEPNSTIVSHKCSGKYNEPCACGKNMVAFDSHQITVKHDFISRYGSSPISWKEN